MDTKLVIRPDERDHLLGLQELGHVSASGSMDMVTIALRAGYDVKSTLVFQRTGGDPPTSGYRLQVDFPAEFIDRLRESL